MTISSPPTAVAAALALVALASGAATQPQGHSLLRVPELSKAEKDNLRDVKRRALERVNPAVVHVMVKVGGVFRVQRDSSGVIVSPDGLVLTNWHLVRELERKKAARYDLQVRTDKGRDLEARVLAMDPHHDLALLQVQLEAGQKLPFLPFADSQKLRPGQTLLACARPNERMQHACFVGGASESQTAIPLRKKTIAKDDILVSDANFRMFTDGGAVVDLAGRLLGIVNTTNVMPALGKDASAADQERFKRSFGFAMRSHVARRVFAKHLARLAPVPADATATGAMQGGLAPAVAQARPAIVSVRRAKHEQLPAVDPADPHGKFTDPSIGSGVIIHPAGLVLTNAHLLDGDTAHVATAAGQSFKGKVLARRAEKNVALIKLELPAGTSLPALPLANSGAAILGERVAALGNRFGHTIAVKSGVLSSRQRDVDAADRHARSRGHFQTDANIYPGNTGGALINIHGELLAINDIKAVVDKPEMEFRRTKEAEKKDMTIGFALPIDWIREQFRAELMEFGSKQLASAPAVIAERQAERTSPAARIVAQHADCFLNIFVKTEKLGRKKTGLMAELFPEPGDDSDFRVLGQGSGVIIDPTGLALSNWHVVDAAVFRDGSAKKGYKVFASLHTGKKYEVEVLSTSRNDDLALLQLKLAPGERLAAIRLGDSDALRVGDTAIAVGNPHGFSNSVTVGLVSAKGRDIMVKGHPLMARGMMQTDAAINPGNSGGALIDVNGYLIGINTAGNSAVAKVGFAIPVNKVREKFHSTLLASDKLRSVYTGLASDVDRSGRVFVAAVGKFGPAAAAGVTKGDVIVRAKGVEITNKLQFVQLCRAAAPHEPLPLELIRGKERVEAVVMPVSEAAWFVFRHAGFAVREVTVETHGKQLQASALAAYRELTGRNDVGGDTLERGLLVTHVNPDAVRAGMDLRKGDILVGRKIRVREIHLQDRDVLETITGLKELQEFIRAQATLEGTRLEIWASRGTKVVKAQVTAKKPGKPLGSRPAKKD